MKDEKKVELVKVNVCDAELEAGKDEAGTVWVSVRRVCEVLGVAEQRQLSKMKNKPWACVTMMVTQTSGDDQRRKVSVIPLKAFPMWLATINVTKVKPELRPTLERFQQEAADVLSAHFLGTLMPQGRKEKYRPITPTPLLAEQIELLALRQKRALELLAAIPGLYGEDYLRHRVEHAVALVTGEKPMIDNPLLSVDGYLQGRGLTSAQRKETGPKFGKRVKALFFERYGQDPPKQPREVNGAERQVFSYTERDRPLFDRAFDEMTTGAPMPELDGERTISLPVPPPPAVDLRLPPPPISPGATFTATEIGQPHNCSPQRVNNTAKLLGIHGNSEFGQFKSFTNEHGVHHHWVFNQRGKLALDDKIQQIISLQ
ncbi:phage antirepressor N-terminal domain-containing protein [Polyangium mundeleinium]|uniref:Phage antirepressor N-terminal domain-containing protein n=1 Tax=Polyangium mundeleinium TaxID=2995306 RepID=A0ABT5F785_9BACT|nr:phage antirepressor N-terminal domain-containing protein [Polyangium mundeleinium]MDC0749955.1 phage antirepressor N-terminal domain-containing protein [Polyangium mundeleinium]